MVRVQGNKERLPIVCCQNFIHDKGEARRLAHNIPFGGLVQGYLEHPSHMAAACRTTSTAEFTKTEARAFFPFFLQEAKQRGFRDYIHAYL